MPWVPHGMGQMVKTYFVRQAQVTVECAQESLSDFIQMLRAYGDILKIITAKNFALIVQDARFKILFERFDQGSSQYNLPQMIPVNNAAGNN